VLGLLGGLVTLVPGPAGRAIGWVAGWPAWWIIQVAARLAGLKGAAVTWPVGPVALILLGVGCAVLAVTIPGLLRRPVIGVLTALVRVGSVLQAWGRLGWPPRSWLMAMCDVGQGDALALNAGPGSAVVVDAGPDARLVARCLDDLGVRSVPLVVLTHFHAD